jgi:hypothetical protein
MYRQLAVCRHYVLCAYVVPPALSKVWQLRLESVLHQLKPNANHNQDKHITNN